MLPRFEVVSRQRPVDLVAPSAVQVDRTGPLGPPGTHPTPQPAPYAAVCVDLPAGESLDGRLSLDLAGAGDVRLTGWYDGARGVAALAVDAQARTTTHRSRRHGRVSEPVRGLALTLTGTHLTVFTHAGDRWTARGRVDLTGRVDTRDEPWLASLTSSHRWTGSDAAPVARLTAGGFGQLGLRDIRLVTHEDGEPCRADGLLLLTATSAGPGFFDTAHTSVWGLDPATAALTHRADLFFRRPDLPGVFGDHATHLVRTGDGWLVATSTWGDFERRRPGARVDVTLAESGADLTAGRHVLDTRPLALPTAGLRSVGVWDPHLVRVDGRWLVGFVSAPKFFRFHPALAEGATLDDLALRGAAADRIATEGTTLARLPDGWRVLASDGRDGRPGQRRRYPVFDLDLAEVGGLDAPYPSNIPWPTIVRDGNGWLLIGFDGSSYGGPLPGYGTHGTVVLARTAQDFASTGEPPYAVT